MQPKNILIGPKLGDLFHMLTVPKYIHYFYGIKSNIYITEKFDKFSTGLEDTYQSLYEIITSQPFTESFQIYNNEAIDIDLNLFRTNGIWCTRPFWAIFLHTAFPSCPTIPKNFKILNWKKNDKYQDYLIKRFTQISHGKDLNYSTPLLKKDFYNFINKEWKHSIIAEKKKKFYVQTDNFTVIKKNIN